MMDNPQDLALYIETVARNMVNADDLTSFRSIMASAELPHDAFKYALFENVNFDNQDLTGIDFTCATFSNCSMRNCKFDQELMPRDFVHKTNPEQPKKFILSYFRDIHKIDQTISKFSKSKKENGWVELETPFSFFACESEFKANLAHLNSDDKIYIFVSARYLSEHRTMHELQCVMDLLERNTAGSIMNPGSVLFIAKDLDLYSDYAAEMVRAVGYYEMSNPELQHFVDHKKLFTDYSISDDIAKNAKTLLNFLVKIDVKYYWPENS